MPLARIARPADNSIVQYSISVYIVQMSLRFAEGQLTACPTGFLYFDVRVLFQLLGWYIVAAIRGVAGVPV